MSNLLEQIHDVVDSVLERMNGDAQSLLRRAGAIINRTGMMALLAGLALIGLLAVLASIVVALTPPLGVAGALAIVGVPLLCAGAAGIIMLRQRTKAKPAISEDEIGTVARNSGIGKAARLNGLANSGDSQAQHTPQALPRAAQPPQGTPATGTPFDNLPQFDPLFVAASVGALAALLGPSRMVRLLGTVTAGIALTQKLAPLGELVRAYRNTQELSVMARELRDYATGDSKAGAIRRQNQPQREHEYADL